jgi:hypothetical protein
MRERDKRFPRESICFCVLVPMNLGGAKNLTVKSILWRGSAYRFPSLSVHSIKKKERKNWRKRDMHGTVGRGIG